VLILNCNKDPGKKNKKKTDNPTTERSLQRAEKLCHCEQYDQQEALLSMVFFNGNWGKLQIKTMQLVEVQLELHVLQEKYQALQKESIQGYIVGVNIILLNAIKGEEREGHDR
jgi:hypothetical protein